MDFLFLFVIWIMTAMYYKSLPQFLNSFIVTFLYLGDSFYQSSSFLTFSNLYTNSLNVETETFLLSFWSPIGSQLLFFPSFSKFFVSFGFLLFFLEQFVYWQLSSIAQGLTLLFRFCYNGKNILLYQVVNFSFYLFLYLQFTKTFCYFHQIVIIFWAKFKYLVQPMAMQIILSSLSLLFISLTFQNALQHQENYHFEEIHLFCAFIQIVASICFYFLAYQTEPKDQSSWSYFFLFYLSKMKVPTKNSYLALQNNYNKEQSHHITYYKQQQIIMKTKDESILNISNKTSFMSQKKYLHHFETINSPTKNTLTKIISTQKPNKDYTSKMESYVNNTSIIDKIISTQTIYNPSKTSVLAEEFVHRPMLVNVHYKVRQNVEKTIDFFSNKKQQHIHNLVEPSLDLHKYITTLKNIDLRKKTNSVNQNQEMFEKTRLRSKSRSRSKYSNEKQALFSQSPIINIKQVQQNVQSAQTTEKRMKKIDLLLIQIMREKKRKGLVSDYYNAMEMKLTQLLQYIILGQEEYYGLNLHDKMKKILKNLQSFKGKMVDGELKVNMLRIFFEEFTNLKKQKQGAGEKAGHNKVLQGKSNASSSQRAKKPPNAFDMGLKQKSKKNMQTMSMGRRRKESATSKVAASTVKKEDEWIGSLQ